MDVQQLQTARKETQRQSGIADKSGLVAVEHGSLRDGERVGHTLHWLGNKGIAVHKGCNNLEVAGDRQHSVFVIFEN